MCVCIDAYVSGFFVFLYAKLTVCAYACYTVVSECIHDCESV